jgi:hypothetical protein
MVRSGRPHGDGRDAHDGARESKPGHDGARHPKIKHGDSPRSTGKVGLRISWTARRGGGTGASVRRQAESIAWRTFSSTARSRRSSPVAASRGTRPASCHWPWIPRRVAKSGITPDSRQRVRATTTVVCRTVQTTVGFAGLSVTSPGSSGTEWQMRSTRIGCRRSTVTRLDQDLKAWSAYHPLRNRRP